MGRAQVTMLLVMAYLKQNTQYLTHISVLLPSLPRSLSLLTQITMIISYQIIFLSL